MGALCLILLMFTLNSVLALHMIEPTKKCRDRTGYWDVELFNRLACSNCYGYMFKADKELRTAGPNLISIGGGVFKNYSLVVPDIHNESVLDQICATLDKDECYRWTECCLSAHKCCQDMLIDDNIQTGDNNTTQCPQTWDGYSCWSASAPDTEVAGTCPLYIPHAGLGGYAYKQCTVNGTWYQASGMEWSDYTQCVESHLQDFQVKMYLSIACSAVSILVLIPSIIIFLAYRPLRSQHRIQLHLHLFVSFILSASIHIIWEMAVVHDRMNAMTEDTLVHRNTGGCKLIYILTRYTRTTNYLWMFCEAFYLHKLIVQAFETPNSLLLFYVLGWGFPWLPIIMYSIVKAIQADERCWINNMGAWEWAIYIPNLLTLVMNFIFLINILRILLTQLQSHPNEPSNYRRAFKATALLVPLFGLQLFLIIYRPPHGSPGAQHYETFSAFVTSSQGFFVALIFCFLNGEVHSHLKKSFGHCTPDRLHRHHSGRTSMMSTQLSEAYSNTEQCSSRKGSKKKNYMPMTTLNAKESEANGSTAFC